MVSLYAFVLLPPGVAILIRPTAGLLREAHTAAWRLLAVLAGHETLLLEPTGLESTAQ